MKGSANRTHISKHCKSISFSYASLSCLTNFSKAQCFNCNILHFSFSHFTICLIFYLLFGRTSSIWNKKTFVSRFRRYEIDKYYLAVSMSYSFRRMFFLYEREIFQHSHWRKEKIFSSLFNVERISIFDSESFGVHCDNYSIQSTYCELK